MTWAVNCRVNSLVAAKTGRALHKRVYIRREKKVCETNRFHHQESLVSQRYFVCNDQDTTFEFKFSLVERSKRVPEVGVRYFSSKNHPGDA
jgi:hypothetical protein